MQTTPAFTTLMVPYQDKKQNQQELISQLGTLSGVQEVLLVEEEEVLYLRIDKALYQPGSVEKMLREF